MLDKIKKHFFTFSLALISLTLGIVLLFIDASKLMRTLYIIFGVIMMVNGCLVLLDFMKIDPVAKTYGLLSIIAGILFCFYHGLVIAIISMILFLAFPIYRIILARNKKDQFFKELPRIILAIMILFLGFDNIFVKSLGIFMILMTLFIFFNIIFTKEKLSDIEKQEAINVNFEERDSK